MRQTSYDWRREDDPKIAIIRLDDAPPLRPEEISARIAKLNEYTTGLIRMGMGLTRWYREHHGVNTIKISQFQKTNNPYPGQVYLDGAFEIADDEALVVETDLPRECRYWQILLADDRFATINWINHHSSINGFQAKLDKDGKFRAVISRNDPGVPNWLETAGEPWGIIQMRWNHASDHPEPRVTKVPFSSVRDHLPADTPIVSPAERKEALQRRWEEAQFRRWW
jgi:hypothetical protein